MFFAFPVFIHALLFFIGLELAAFAKKEIAVIIVLMSAVTLISLWGARKIGKKRIHCAIPSIFSLSAFTLLYLVSSTAEKQLLIILSAALYYLGMLGIFRISKYEKDRTARGMLAAFLAAAVFFFCASAYGIYINFAVPVWGLMVSYLLATTGVSYQYLRLITENKKMARGYSAILGMIMAEIAWVISFWPFGYLTTGAIALMLYYIFWDLTQSFFLDLLSKKRVAINMIFFSLLITLVLATSRWLPAV